MKNQRLGIRASAGIRGALVHRAHHHTGLEYNERPMKKIREVTETDEPIGIIISRGDRKEAKTVVSAYIWGPPEPVLDNSTTKVA
jgi:hypothetical protein